MVQLCPPPTPCAALRLAGVRGSFSPAPRVLVRRDEGLDGPAEHLLDAQFQRLVLGLAIVESGFGWVRAKAASDRIASQGPVVLGAFQPAIDNPSIVAMNEPGATVTPRPGDCRPAAVRPPAARCAILKQVR